MAFRGEYSLTAARQRCGDGVTLLEARRWERLLSERLRPVAPSRMLFDFCTRAASSTTGYAACEAQPAKPIEKMSREEAEKIAMPSAIRLSNASGLSPAHFMIITMS